MEGYLTGYLESESVGLRTGKSRQGGCLASRHQVTFASLHKITFYSDYSSRINIDNMQLFLEKEACATIEKLKGTSYFYKGIIGNIVSDINGSEGIIYYEVILSTRITQRSLVEIISGLNKLLIAGY